MTGLKTCAFPKRSFAAPVNKIEGQGEGWQSKNKGLSVQVGMGLDMGREDWGKNFYWLQNQSEHSVLYGMSKARGGKESG